MICGPYFPQCPRRPTERERMKARRRYRRRMRRAKRFRAKWRAAVTACNDIEAEKALDAALFGYKPTTATEAGYMDLYETVMGIRLPGHPASPESGSERPS